MEIDFANCSVLVTASTAGIGFAAAKGFLATGANVVINGRSNESVADAVDQLATVAPNIAGFAGDLGTKAGCSLLVDRFPDFDIIVNNLGIYGPQDFFYIADEEWERFFQTNVMSGVRLARAYASRMAERGWGRVIFISSESAINIPSDMIHYGLTQTSQLAVSRGLAKRLAGTGVAVNAVLPGPTLLGGRCRHVKGQRGAGSGFGAGRNRFRRCSPRLFDYPPYLDRGRCRQHGPLCRFRSGVGDHRGSPSGRWRRGG